MERYELVLISVVAVVLCGLIVFFERVLGAAEPPAGFVMKSVPIYCGPASLLREHLLKTKSRPVFSGSAFEGAFMIFQREEGRSSAFLATFWRDGSGCIVASGADAQIHQSIQWTMSDAKKDQDGE